jgi:hypothetical protein
LQGARVVRMGGVRQKLNLSSRCVAARGSATADSTPTNQPHLFSSMARPTRRPPCHGGRARGAPGATAPPSPGHLEQGRAAPRHPPTCCASGGVLPCRTPQGGWAACVAAC